MSAFLYEIAKIIHKVCLLLGIVSFFLTISAGQVEQGYELYWTLPLTFIFFSLFIRNSLARGEGYITKICLMFFSLIRYVLSPMLSSISGFYNSVDYLTTNPIYINRAILMMDFELIAASVFVYLYTHSTRRSRDKYARDNSELCKISGSHLVYTMFIFFAFLLYIAVGRNTGIIQIGVITSEYTDIVDNSFLVLVRQIIKIALFLLFLLVLEKCKEKYERKHARLYFFLPLIFGIMNILVIVGQRRSEQLAMSVIVFIIMIHEYPSYKKTLFISIAIAFISMMLYLTLYKRFFNYGIMISAGDAFNMKSIIQSLQLYVGGTQNLAETIAMRENGIKGNLFYDVCRSVFGLSFLLKGKTPMTIELFNSFIYGIQKSNGHVLSSTGYSYLYFSELFCFVCICVNLYFSFRSENRVMHAKDYENMYIFGYLLVRFSTNLFAFTIPLINFSTLTLGTAGLLYVFAKHFRLKRY